MNKTVIAQIDTTAGDITANAAKIKNCIIEAKNNNADLIIFPELALIGFPFGSILSRYKDIIERQIQAINDISKITDNITALVGYVEKDNENNLYNSIALIQNGEILYSQRKFALNFKELQYFKQNKENFKSFEINGEKYCILLGDDCIYHKNLITEKIDTVINCACSPSRTGSEYAKNSVFTSVVKKYNVNYIYVNKAGYADNYVFEGSSRIYDKNAKLIFRAKSFEEDIFYTDNTNEKIYDLPLNSDKQIDLENFEVNYFNDLARTYKSIVFAIKMYFKKNGFNKAVLGLSGGLDSSVCAVLLADALGSKNVLGVSMPSKITSQESKNDALILAKNLGINFIEIPLKTSIVPTKSLLKDAFEKIDSEMENYQKYEKPTTLENLQARTRATLLWSISNEYKNMLCIATSDKSESYIGYATVNGDMSGGFAPIADVTKTKLFALAKFMNENRQNKNAIPLSVLTKPPGAELKINPQTGKTVCAEDDNMPYEFLDEIIWLVENKHFSKSELFNHSFFYEQKHAISQELKEEWINKFYIKSKYAIYKWHILPPSVIVDVHSINSAEYHQPIISKVF